MEDLELLELDNLLIFIYLGIIFVIIESIAYTIIKNVNKKFQWLIIQKDEEPKLSKEGLEKFIPHGYDAELGWVRKPNTNGEETGKYGTTKWSINAKGSRNNPDFENFDTKISCYGDSFTFGRQVNDNQTWEYFLSKNLKTNVLNFGVGNYGLDQALLRLKREYSNNKTEIVILGVVPDTIRRILNVWKHYFEYGNTFGFKPKFKIENNELKLIPNFIDNEQKFLNYKNYLNEIRKEDYFYKNKFLQEKISFPYSISILKNPKRNLKIIFRVYENYFRKNKKNIVSDPKDIVMNINQKWTVNLFKNKMATDLLKKILEEYVLYSQKCDFKGIFIFLPQKNDMNFIKKNYNFLKNFISEISKNPNLIVIDIIDDLLDHSNLDELFSLDNEYGGHFSTEGNKKIAEIINQKMKKLELI